MSPGFAGADGACVRLEIEGGPEGAWLAALRAVAGGRISIVTGAGLATGDSAWRHLLRQALSADAGGGRAGSPPIAEAAALPEPPLPGERWRFEDEAGCPLFSPLFAARAWQRPPYSMTLRLVAQRAEGRELLAEAHVGTRESYADLLRQLARSALVLLEKALSESPPEPMTIRDPVPGRWPVSTAGALASGALRRQALRLSRRFAVETWAVGIVERPIAQVLAGGELGPVAWLPWDDREGYLADPFPWPGSAGRFLCERFIHRARRGDLVAIDGRDPGRQIPIDIPETRHLSYPGAWQEGHEVLLMPESGASRRTVIYRLDPQAHAKPWVTVAEDIGMADPTLFRHGGLYWIAYTDTDIGLHDNLCLMFAAQLQGPWRRHPANPVKLDIRSSRPAGPLFESGQAWYRPAQDCAADYGAALAINRLVELSPQRFREEVVTVLQPDRRGAYPHGLHTLSVWGDRLLVDGKRWRRRPQLLADKIAYRLRRGADS